MKSDYITEDGRGVDYKSLKESSLLPEYETLAVNLQFVLLDNLSDKEKMAFFISILFMNKEIFSDCYAKCLLKVIFLLCGSRNASRGMR